MRIHSWSLVYFRSAGYMSAPRSFVEWQRHDAGASAAVAHVDVEFRVGGRGRRDVGHPDGFLEEWRPGSAGHVPGGHPANEHRMALPRDRAIDHLEADEAPRQARLLLCLERRAADEPALRPRDDPLQIGLEHRRGV